MKSTGIVRRLDDLGRLVIPKEIRKQFRMKEGDSIEFYIENDRIIIQKFDSMSNHLEQINYMCETLNAIYDNRVYFIQDDWLKMHNIVISDEFMKLAATSRPTNFENKVVTINGECCSGVIYPINSFGDWHGAFIIIFDKKDLQKPDFIAVEAFTQLLSRQQNQ